MNRQVFISYSNQDRTVAESIHDALEKADMPAWMAHRDLTAGVSWSHRIIEEIHASRVFILILSRHANESRYVIREVGEAVERQLSIVTVRIDDVPPSQGLKFFIGSEQWLDAFGKAPDQYLPRLVADVRLLLDPSESRHEPPAQQSRAPEPVAIPARDSEHRPSASARKRRTVGLSVSGIVLVALAALGLNALAGGRAGLVIASTPPDVFVGDSFQLEVDGERNGIIWSSTDPAIVSVTPEEGVFRAVGTGTALLAARAGRSRDSVRVTVRGRAIGSLAISPPPDLQVGDSIALRALASDPQGKTLAASPRWSSETPAIVSVNENGVVVALARGRGRITARVDTATAVVDILVTAASSAGPSRRTLTDVPQRPTTDQRPPPSDPAQQRAAPAPIATPTDAELRALANQCTDALGKADRTWVTDHYDPETPADYENLRKLQEVLSRSGYTFTVSEVFTPRPAEARIDFRAEFNYRSFSGRSVRARGTFRLSTEAPSGSWRVRSCRVVGDFVVG